MNEIQILNKFAGRFVIKKFQERFVHEAIKRPKDLHRRICHQISTVFGEVYEGMKISFDNKDKCLFLSWGEPIYLTTWKEAKEVMSSGGGGYLVIKEDGSGFYAETEAYPATIYSGSS
ncbi:MAG: hypothetical protein FP814_01690 [Desulfobacterium sp.]|nr:hypothetical protein [Desulfobacterium sp.]MBU3949178.1 hypothetical protein [Pseudomonadota bacterium]MBU4037407.1 hypothetical protein [Pseudomonadota bacterium]